MNQEKAREVVKSYLNEAFVNVSLGGEENE